MCGEITLKKRYLYEPADFRHQNQIIHSQMIPLYNAKNLFLVFHTFLL